MSVRRIIIKAFPVSEMFVNRRSPVNLIIATCRIQINRQRLNGLQDHNTVHQDGQFTTIITTLGYSQLLPRENELMYISYL